MLYWRSFCGRNSVCTANLKEVGHNLKPPISSCYKSRWENVWHLCKLFTNNLQVFQSHASVKANLFLKRVACTVQVLLPYWWLSSASGSQMSSTRSAGGVTTFGVWKEWGCRPRNLDESSVPLDFWYDSGLSRVKCDVWLPQHQVIYIPDSGRMNGGTSLGWALHPAQPSLCWLGQYGHRITCICWKGKLSLLPCFPITTYSFLGEGAWPVFSYHALHMAIQILGYTQDIREGAVSKNKRGFLWRV